jgi:hypothetical protein
MSSGSGLSFNHYQSWETTRLKPPTFFFVIVAFDEDESQEDVRVII